VYLEGCSDDLLREFTVRIGFTGWGGPGWRAASPAPRGDLPRKLINASPITNTNIRTTPATTKSVFWYFRKTRKGLAMRINA